MKFKTFIFCKRRTLRSHRPSKNQSTLPNPAPAGCSLRKVRWTVSLFAHDPQAAEPPIPRRGRREASGGKTAYPMLTKKASGVRLPLHVASQDQSVLRVFPLYLAGTMSKRLSVHRLCQVQP